jgi:hypothetical protein
MKHYLLRVIIAIDILAMTLFNGKRNETISACLWSMEQSGKWLGYTLRPVVDFLLSPLEKDHCALSWMMENREAV